jgi:hypothetical protein
MILPRPYLRHGLVVLRARCEDDIPVFPRTLDKPIIVIDPGWNADGLGRLNAVPAIAQQNLDLQAGKIGVVSLENEQAFKFMAVRLDISG